MNNLLSSMLFSQNTHNERKHVILDGTIVIDTGVKENWYDHCSISKKTYDEFYKIYSKYKINDNLTIHLTTMGGEIFYILMIMNIINSHKGTVTAVIDKYCMGSGLLIALACDKIKIRSSAALGYINIQKYMNYPLTTFNDNLKIWIDKFKESGQLSSIVTNVELVYKNTQNIEDQYIEKIVQLLSKVYSKEDLDEILTFFYRNPNKNNMPLFMSDIPSSIKVKIDWGEDIESNIPAISSKLQFNDDDDDDDDDEEEENNDYNDSLDE